MLMMGFLLVFAATNGLTISPWMWVIFAAQAFFEMVSIVQKASRDN